MLGAAGAIEAALTVLAVSKNTIPPTRNLDTISEDIELFLQSKNEDTDGALKARSIELVQNDSILRDINVAMSNSFGFGGTNVSLLFGKTAL